MVLDQVLAMARKHLGGDMESSARLCLADAIALRDAGDYEHAKKRALDSLSYSIGILHADYAKAAR